MLTVLMIFAVVILFGAAVSGSVKTLG
jgi:hypothetical protein